MELWTHSHPSHLPYPLSLPPVPSTPCSCRSRCWHSPHAYWGGKKVESLKAGEMRQTFSHVGHRLRVPLCFGRGQPNALGVVTGLSQVSTCIWKNSLSLGLRHRIFSVLQTVSQLLLFSPIPFLFSTLSSLARRGLGFSFCLFLSQSLLARTALEFSGPVVLESSKWGHSHAVGASAFFPGIPPLRAEPSFIWDVFTFSGLILGGSPRQGHHFWWIILFPFQKTASEIPQG